MRSWFRNASFLLLIGCSLGNLGLLSSEVYRLIGFLAFAIFISTLSRGIHPPRRGQIKELSATLLIILAGTILMFFAPLGVLYFYLFILAGLFVLSSGEDSPEVRLLGVYIVTLSSVALLSELQRILPLLWHLKMGLASLLSRAAQSLAREPRNLGPTAMGLPLLGALSVLVLVRGALSEHRRPLRWAINLLIIWSVHLFYLVILRYYARWIASRQPGLEGLILNSQHLFLILGSAAYTLIDRERTVSSFEPWSRRRTLGASLAVLAIGFAIVAWLGWEAPPKRTHARVMIYDEGYVNWLIPVHGKYGERSAGMFGMLPSTLEAVGFEVVVSNDLKLLDQSDAPECIIMINIQKFFEDKDKKRIWNYIAGGGGLLCLGDHTGVAGIRGPFNDLLQRAGIRFRFDSATFFGRGWNDALEYRNHPLNRDITSAEDFQIWVGASLDLDLRARPVVVGRYGYSDLGNPANIERSYLGDRRYNPNELLGDVVLVADAHYGKGKVMVFGDTSGYQNLSLARSLDTVARSLYYLTGKGNFAPGTGAQSAGLLLAFASLLAAIAYSRSSLPVVAIAVGLGLGSGIARAATPGLPPLVPRFLEKSPDFSFTPTPHVKRDLAILDFSHGGRFTLRAWEDRSVGGLELNLARNGYLPLIRSNFPYRELKEAKLLLLLSPTRGYNRKEIDAVEEFLVGGGEVIVTVGFEEFDGSRDLLEHFGVTLANVPLGRFVVEANPDDTLMVDFHEAWPLQIARGASAEVLLSQSNLPLAVRLSVGKGKLIVIGDSSFFYDVNLESRDRYFAGNVTFLRRITEAGGRL